MQNIWLTADTHFGHSNIMRYCNRPFTTHEEMDETMITRFNEVIKKGDILYHLGDLAWSTYPLRSGFLDRLNTKEVHLVLGNHDDPKRLRNEPFRTQKDINRITLDGGRVMIVMCHYAMRTWRNQGHGAYQLYGHSHGKLADSGMRQMDVGVDTNNFYPYHIDEVINRLKDRPYYASDVASQA